MGNRYSNKANELIQNTNVDGFGQLVKDFMINQLQKESELNALIERREYEIKCLQEGSYKKIISIFRKIIPYMRSNIKDGNYIVSFENIPLSFDEHDALTNFLIETDSINYHK